MAFTISVNADCPITQVQGRAITHDDPDNPDESTSPTCMAVTLITLTATATDGDSDAATANIVDSFTFRDDGPTLAVGNLVGAGTTRAQIGFWS